MPFYDDDDIGHLFHGHFKHHDSWLEENKNTIIYVAVIIAGVIGVICTCCCYKKRRGRVLTVPIRLPPATPAVPPPHAAPYPQQQYTATVPVMTSPYPPPTVQYPAGPPPHCAALPSAPHNEFASGPTPPGWNRPALLPPPSYNQAMTQEGYEKHPPYNPHHNPSY